MYAVLSLPLWKYGLALWLLVTNLSLGLYHRHGTEEGRAPLTSPSAWHYHLALFGLHLDFLSVNADDCPFDRETPPRTEVHVLLGSAYVVEQGNLNAADADVPAPLDALPSPLLTNVPLELTALAACSSRDDKRSFASLAALGARSGVQQI
jgi:hypothetical protein